MKEDGKVTKEIMDLQLFAEGGNAGAGAGAGEGAASPGTEAGEGAATPKAPVFKSSRRGAKADPFANVIFGKQGTEGKGAPEPARKQGKAGTEPAAPPVDRNAAFDQLMKGEYKDLFDARMQDARKQGEDSMRGDAERYRQLSPLLEILGRKHGITPDYSGNFDLNKLSAAVKAEDDNYWAEEALRTGEDKDVLKQKHEREQLVARLQRENASLREAEQRRLGEERARKTYAMWTDQAAKAKNVYPSLDLNKELAGNPKFGELLRAGVDVKTAFEVIHKDEIMPAAMGYAAQHVEQKLGAKIAAQAARPRENGGNSPVQTKTDVASLTRAERREIAKRVARGERITF